AIYFAALGAAGFSRPDAEDAMQDAFEALLKHQNRYDDEIRHPVAWMKKVTFRAALRKKKESGIHSLVGFMSDLPEYALADADPMSLHSEIAALELLTDALKVFPEGPSTSSTWPMALPCGRSRRSSGSPR